jgi:hypothetical protein
MAHRKSDAPIRARTRGNARRAKGGTYGHGLDGDAGHTQRWTRGDHGNRVHRQTGFNPVWRPTV